MAAAIVQTMAGLASRQFPTRISLDVRPPCRSIQLALAQVKRVSAVAAYCRPCRRLSEARGSPALPLASRGDLLSTSVQAEKQGPSTITR
jgi:hypothetical protein